MSAPASAQNATRLSDWIPLDLKEKPLYAGVNETERISDVRMNINADRTQWNKAEEFQSLTHSVEEALNARMVPEDLRSTLRVILGERRSWADHNRSLISLGDHWSADTEEYGALEAYTTNDGFKKIFGHMGLVE